MKFDQLHLEVTAENLDTAVENALAKLKCTRAEADVVFLVCLASVRPGSGLSFMIEAL
jgi:hypothetical protein